ncbi:TPA: hypothetical protein ACF3XO_004483 [Vibrio parahaemolyticus]|uniref:hypothetical protein n=1 Tax=Vibrio sp. 99K-1 TaxID=2607603 RepID=UPI001493716F|nr:hypothetical protein [Vibrio sp. 99K-1]NOI88229.1 hypothetical protein [Vibrio sp. 99K-1]
MYLVQKPFTGSIVACVESNQDPKIPEILKRCNVSGEWNVIDDDELTQLFDTYEQSLCSLPKTCTAERFNDMFEILPPCQWSTVGGVEMFHVSERLYGNVVSWFFNYQNAFYTCEQLASASKTDLSEMVKAAYNAAQ